HFVLRAHDIGGEVDLDPRRARDIADLEYLAALAQQIAHRLLVGQMGARAPDIVRYDRREAPGPPFIETEEPDGLPIVSYSSPASSCLRSSIGTPFRTHTFTGSSPASNS